MTVSLWFTEREHQTMTTLSFPTVADALSHWGQIDDGARSVFAFVTIRDEDEELIAELQPPHVCDVCGGLVINSPAYEGFGLCEQCADEMDALASDIEFVIPDN